MLNVLKTNVTFNELRDMCWSGAVNTLERVEEEGKGDALIELLEEYFYETTPTETIINDLLWFEDEWIFEHLGIIEKDEKEDVSCINFNEYQDFTTFCGDHGCFHDCPLSDVSDCEDTFNYWLKRFKERFRG